MDTVMQAQREVPVIADVDVCVIGGGPGGLPAALAAARQGADTMVVEMQGFFGGMATAGQVGPILGHTGSRAHNPTIAGLAQEICERMAAIGEATPWEQAVKQWGISFNTEGLKVIADRMIQEAGVKTMLHTFFVDSLVESGRMTHALVASKSGIQAIRAKVFVDATGDADVAFRAGCECTHGRPADGKPMAMGSMFRIGGTETLTPEVKKACMEKTREAVQGGLNMYNAGMGGHGSTIRAGEASVNMTRYGGDSANVADLTEGEFVTRDLAWKVLEVWRSVPGAEGLYMISTPPHVGVRESRQIVGESRLTGPDVVAGRKFDDSVARCSYWIDIHCPRGMVSGGQVHLCMKSCPQSDCYMLTEHLEELPDELYPSDGDWCGIPYGTLVPKGIDGILVSGRCISADYQAMAASRVMGPCLAIGEAAGTAAGMAVKAAVTPREVDVQALRKTLTDNGALV